MIKKHTPVETEHEFSSAQIAGLVKAAEGIENGESKGRPADKVFADLRKKYGVTKI
jgi:hypothetical protein